MAANGLLARSPGPHGCNRGLADIDTMPMTPNWTDKAIILAIYCGILCLLLSFDWRIAVAWIGSEMLKDFRTERRE
jgi:hypothetical protein